MVDPSTKMDDLEEYRGIKGRIKNLTPAWFGPTMGTGIVAILLHQLPYQFPGLGVISTVIFLVNAVMFVALCIGSIIRYVVWPQRFIETMLSPVQSCSWGSFALGYLTLVSMCAYVAVPVFGYPMLLFTEIIFWIGLVATFLACLSVILLLVTVHPHTISSVSGLFILAVVPMIDAAATGAVVCTVIPATSPALYRTMLACYIVWGFAFPLANVIIAIYFLRLILYKVPGKNDIASIFLPIGPLGRGSFAIVDLGIIAKKAQILSATNAQIWCSITLFLGLLIWSWALIWILIAFTGLFTTLRKGRLPFNLGWWAFTFPLGTFGLASGVLSGQLDSTFFRVVATVVTITVVGFWILVSVKSILLLVGDGKRFMQVSLGLQQVDVPQKDKVEGKKDFGLEKRLSESPTRSNSSNGEA